MANKTKLKKKTEDDFDKAFGIWKYVKDSIKYVRDIRKEWEIRRKRLGL